jgi:hypothetical protein
VPDSPPQPTYISSSNSEIVISFQRSPSDGGLPIIDYNLEVDGGDVLSEFDSVFGYSFSTDGYACRVDAVLNLMVPGLMYRFRVQSQNSLGFSYYSQVLMVGLGPLPSTPTAPVKTTDDSNNSQTSIMLKWTPLPT